MTIDNLAKIRRRQISPRDSFRGRIIMHRMETIPEESETSENNCIIPQSSPILNTEVTGENNSVPSVMKDDAALYKDSTLIEGNGDTSQGTEKSIDIGNEQITTLEETTATAESSVKLSQHADTPTSSRTFTLFQKSKSIFFSTTFAEGKKISRE